MKTHPVESLPPVESFVALLDCKLYNDRQIAAMLGFSVASLKAWRFQGGGPRYIKLGRSVRYRLADIHEWIESGVRRSTSDAGANADDAAR